VADQLHDAGHGAPNIRNGSTAKTLKTDLGSVQVRTPRDRDSSFEPQLVAKRQTRLAGLDQRIIGLYAGGISVRDIAEHLSELYGTEHATDQTTDATPLNRREPSLHLAPTSRGKGPSDLVFADPLIGGPA
jgi:transposase-like protein